MVREFPFFHAPVAPDERRQSQGFSTMVKVQANVSAAFHRKDIFRSPVICRRTHQSHPSGFFYGESTLNYSFTLVLLEIAMVIIISRLIRFLLRPLKQPRIVSDILGGIIVGPSVLGRSHKFKTHMFPDNASFVVRNVAAIGFMYFLFISGVKMDLKLVTKAGRKQWCIALLGVTIPMVAGGVVAALVWNSLDKGLATISSIGGVTSSVAIPAFPVLYPILRELNLLSSEVGRQALLTAIISDVVGLTAVVAFEAGKQGEVKAMAALWYVISVVVLMFVIFSGLRPVTTWIVSKTPEGKPVEQGYVIAILLAVLVMGFMTDMFGVAIANGPMWLGLAIPDGPPLGATLTERSETIITELLMPFSFACVGLYTNVDSISAQWSTLGPLCALVIAGYIAKFVTVLGATLYFEMPVRDSLTFSLVMSLRGQVELLLFIHWMDKKMIKIPAFSLLVLLTTGVTAISTFFISILYDPTRPYMIHSRRTIQHTAPNTEFPIVACVHDQEGVAGIINLLDVSNPTIQSPFSVFALHLIELVGRATPVFIDHEQQEDSPEYTAPDAIQNAMQLYQETRQDLVRIHPFTAVAPKRSMYQDICELALSRKAILILLPIRKEQLGDQGRTEIVSRGLQHSVNSNVLKHAPCSVAILVDKGQSESQVVTRSFRGSAHHFVVLFLGGADAREALAYADRMAGNPYIQLTVIRFLSHNYEGDDGMEKKLDDGLVTWFWVKNEANDRVVYKEVVVRNGEDTVAAIQAMNDGSIDLWIVGRSQGVNPVLLLGLTKWSENLELGVIGDYVASPDFGSTASVLVMQQQILRGQGTAYGHPKRFAYGIC